MRKRKPKGSEAIPREFGIGRYILQGRCDTECSQGGNLETPEQLTELILVCYNWTLIAQRQFRQLGDKHVGWIDVVEEFQEALVLPDEGYVSPVGSMSS